MFAGYANLVAAGSKFMMYGTSPMERACFDVQSSKVLFPEPASPRNMQTRFFVAASLCVAPIESNHSFWFSEKLLRAAGCQFAGNA